MKKELARVAKLM